MKINMRGVVLIALLFTACAQSHKHVAPPSNAAVQGGITRAQQSNQNAQRYNDLARGTLERIDAKAEVIRKYWDISK